MSRCQHMEIVDYDLGKFEIAQSGDCTYCSNRSTRFLSLHGSFVFVA